MFATILAGCALDERTSEDAAPVTAGALQSALTGALRDGFVSSSEWTRQLLPLAQQLPHTASITAPRCTPTTS